MLFHSGLVKAKNCQKQECYFRLLKCYLSKKYYFMLVDSSNANKRRRKLDMQRGENTQEQNELWNEIHVNLVRDLESKGLLWRYGVKQVKLWTDMIMDGKCSGVGEEPQ